MKQFKDITEKELKYLRTHSVHIKEMLDMVYFRIVVGEGGSFKVLSAKGRELSLIDCVVNDVNDQIMKFAQRFDPSIDSEIYDTFGECNIGFFYLPVKQTRTISYDKMCERSFILSDFYTKDKSRKSTSTLMHIIKGGDAENSRLYNCYPLIDNFDRLPDNVVPTETDMNNIRELTGGDTFSGNKIEDIEGILIESGGYKFLLKVNDTSHSIEKSTKLIYRDVILEDFVKVISEEKITDAFSNKNYLCAMQDLFIEYIDRSDLLARTVIEPEDTLPPIKGYIGDICYEYLNSTVSLICKNNEVYKNILRILLVAFNGGGKRLFDRFPEQKKQIFEKIISLVKRNQ